METIEVLICTIDDGIRKAAKVPMVPQPDVRYLISWQHSQEGDFTLPAALAGREDVQVIHLKGKGLSANRNHALAHATGDILLLSDDDTHYIPDFFSNIHKAFREHPGADIITFQALDEDGGLIRPYSSTPYRYEERPKGSYVCSWEIACRRRSRLPDFDTRFGLGSSCLACGEEEIFIHTAWRNGLSVCYVPKLVVQTLKETTGTKFLASPAVQRSKGAVLYVMHGAAGAVLRCLKFVLLLPSGTARWQIFRQLCLGINYIRKDRT